MRAVSQALEISATQGRKGFIRFELEINVKADVAIQSIDFIRTVYGGADPGIDRTAQRQRFGPRRNA